MGDLDDAEEDGKYPQEAGAESSKDPSARDYFTVLLVEDDLLTCKQVAKSLKDCSFHVVEAENGRIALDILGSKEGKNVDVVLTDNMMPEVSGIELADRVVTKKEWQPLPVVIMSTEGHQETILKALRAGASDFLVKPLGRDKLESLHRYVRRAAKSFSGKQMPGLDQGSNGRLNHLGSSRHGRQESAAARCLHPSATSAFQPLSQNKRPFEDSLPHSNGKRNCLQHPAESRLPHNFEAPAPKHTLAGQARAASDSQGQTSHMQRQSIASVPHASWPAASADFKLPAPGQLPGHLPGQLLRASFSHPWEHRQHPSTLFEIKPLLRTERSLSTELPHEQWLRRNAAAEKPQGQFVSNGRQAEAARVDSLPYKDPNSAFTSIPPSTHAGAHLEAVPHSQQLLAAQRQPFFGLPASSAHALSSAVMQHHQQQQQLLLQVLNQAVKPQKAQTKSTTAANRKAAIERFRAKRNQRSFEKKVRYTSRQRLAENRPRIRGQFVKASSHDGDDVKDAASTPDSGGQETEMAANNADLMVPA